MRERRSSLYSPTPHSSSPTSSSTTTTTSSSVSTARDTPDLDRLNTISPQTAGGPIWTPPPSLTRSRSSSRSSTPSATPASLPPAPSPPASRPRTTASRHLRSSVFRGMLSDTEREAFEILLKEDDHYTIRVSSNMVNPSGKDYVVSSVKARCLPRESLVEHFIVHMDGVNILSVNYGFAGACEYPRMMKLPAIWEFNSYTVLKNSEQAPRTPIFTEELVTGEIVEGEGVKPPERSFWAKYWMYMIPLGLIIMNAVTQAMNTPEEQAAGQPQQAAVQRAPNTAVRR